MRVIRIVEGTSVDGPGLRTAIYFAGCNHHCEGCHNPSTWDKSAGQEMDMDEIIARVEEAGFNVTFTGGDPLLQADEISRLASELKLRGYDVWCYTGYTFEDVVADEALRPVLDHIDVLVDGPFVLSRRNIGLRFRGSDNQRLIDVDRSLKSCSVIEYEDTDY